MAKVPTAFNAGLGQQTTRPDGTPYQSVNTNADMFGGGLGKSLQDSGSSLMKVASDLREIELKNQKEEDTRNVLEVEKKIRDWKLEKLHGEKGAYTRKGGNAIGVQKEVAEGYTEFSGSLLEGKEIHNPETKARIQAYIDSQGSGIGLELSKYEQAQKKAYDAGLVESRIQGAKEDAALNAGNPQAINTSKALIKSSLAKRADDEGWSGQETQQQIESEVSSMHMLVMDRLLANGQGMDAKQYLEANRKEIDGDDIAKAEKAVVAGALKQNAQAETDRIISLGLDTDDALKQARSLKDPELRDEVVKRVKIRKSEEAAAETANTKALRDGAWEKISQGMTPDQLTPAELAASGRQVESMWTMTRNQAKRGKPFALTTKTGLKAKLEGMTDAEISEVNLHVHKAEMTETDWNKALTRQEKAKRNIEALQKDPEASTAIERVLKQNAPKKLNWGSTKASDDDRAIANKARDAMQDFVERTIERTKTKPSEAELRKEAARILLEVNFDSENWNTFDLSGPVVDLLDKDLSEYSTDIEDIALATGVPKDQLPNLIGAIKESKHQLTIRNIRKVWEANK